MTTHFFPIPDEIANRIAELPAEKLSAINVELAEVLAEILGELVQEDKLTLEEAFASAQSREALCESAD